MAFPTIYFRGQEDISFINPPTRTASQQNQHWIDTTAGHFRAGYARYALAFDSNSSAGGFMLSFTQNYGNRSYFWFGSRVHFSQPINNSGGIPAYGLRFYDANGVLRLRLRNANSQSVAQGSVMTVEKVSAAGVATTLATFGTGQGFTQNPSTTPDKFDVEVNLDPTVGFVRCYINKIPVCDSGLTDTTTDGNTTLCQASISAISGANFASSSDTRWSEIIVADSDTRQTGLISQVGTANGTEHTFDSAAVGNINANICFPATVSQTFNRSGSAGQIDGYTVTPALPAGGYAIVDVGLDALVQIGAGGPQHATLTVRVAGTDNDSATLAPAAYPANIWTLISNDWTTNPNSGAPWNKATDLPNASANYNFAVKSVA